MSDVRRSGHHRRRKRIGYITASQAVDDWSTRISRPTVTSGERRLSAIDHFMPAKYRLGQCLQRS